MPMATIAESRLRLKAMSPAIGRKKGPMHMRMPTVNRVAMVAGARIFQPKYQPPKLLSELMPSASAAPPGSCAWSCAGIPRTGRRATPASGRARRAPPADDRRLRFEALRAQLHDDARVRDQVEVPGGVLRGAALRGEDAAAIAVREIHDRRRVRATRFPAGGREQQERPALVVAAAPALVRPELFDHLPVLVVRRHCVPFQFAADPLRSLPFEGCGGSEINTRRLARGSGRVPAPNCGGRADGYRFYRRGGYFGKRVG